MKLGVKMKMSTPRDVFGSEVILRADLDNGIRNLFVEFPEDLRQRPADPLRRDDVDLVILRRRRGKSWPCRNALGGGVQARRCWGEAKTSIGRGEQKSEGFGEGLRHWRMLWHWWSSEWKRVLALSFFYLKKKILGRVFIIKPLSFHGFIISFSFSWLEFVCFCWSD